MEATAEAKTKCMECRCTDSLVWHKSRSADFLCDKCFSVTSRRLYVNLSGSSISVSPEKSKSGEKNASEYEKTSNEKLNNAEGNDLAINSEFQTTTNDSCNEDMQEDDLKNSSRRSRSDRSSTAERYYSIRKSTRVKATRTRHQNNVKVLPTKGRGRRIIFKKNPVRAPPAVSSSITRDYIFHKGTYWQVGDIASVIDCEDDKLYYAQLRGFLQDQYLEKSAVISWLIPNQPTNTACFNPRHYSIGIEEDLPRKMDIFEFVCHAPSDYYRATGIPYRSATTQPELGFIWTRLGSALIEPLDSLLQRMNEEFDERLNNEDDDASVISEEGNESEELGTRREVLAGGRKKEGSNRDLKSKKSVQSCSSRVKDRTSRI